YKGSVTPPGYPKKHSTFSRTKQSRRTWAPVINLVDILSSSQNGKATVRGFVSPASGQVRIPTKSGRSGGAGYTDPNNKNDARNWNKFGRDRVAARESLVGICK